MQGSQVPWGTLDSTSFVLLPVLEAFKIGSRLSPSHCGRDCVPYPKHLPCGWATLTKLQEKT